MTDFPKRLRTRLAFVGCAAFGLFGCGGGGSENAAAAPPAVTPTAVTAYAKTSNTVLYADKNYGLARSTAQALIDQCNQFRGSYGLPAVSPTEATLAALDVTVEERYFTSDKALTSSVGHLLDLTDYTRWRNDLKTAPASNPLPAVAPDCAQSAPLEVRTATLWRDGIVYELRYDTKKAVATRASTQIPVPAEAAALYAKAPVVKVLDQQCRDIVGGTGVAADSHSCVWDAFPYENKLNWPFLLAGRVQFGPAAARTYKTIVTLAAQQGQAIDSNVFAIPAGFAVIAP